MSLQDETRDPAYKLGYSDAMAAKPIDHDQILKRLGKAEKYPRLFVADWMTVRAQRLYEEGRLAAIRAMIARRPCP